MYMYKIRSHLPSNHARSWKTVQLEYALRSVAVTATVTLTRDVVLMVVDIRAWIPYPSHILPPLESAPMITRMLYVTFKSVQTPVKTQTSYAVRTAVEVLYVSKVNSLPFPAQRPLTA